MGSPAYTTCLAIELQLFIKPITVLYLHAVHKCLTALYSTHVMTTTEITLLTLREAIEGNLSISYVRFS